MGWFDRVIVFLLMLLVLALGLALLGLSLGLVPPYAIDWALYYLDFQLEVGIAGAVLALLSLKVLAGSGRRRVEPEPETVSRPLEGGDLQISVSAIQELVQKSARKVEGLREHRTEVKPGQEGVKITVHVAAAPDVDISAATSELQEAIKQKVLETMGVVVEHVRVVVERMAGDGEGGAARSKVQ